MRNFRHSRSLPHTRRRILLALLGAVISTQSAMSADLLVTSNADSGPGSLREALTNAESGDRVVFDFAVNTTITLASALPSITVDLSFATSNPIDATIDRNGFAALELAGGSIDPTSLIVTNIADDTDINVASGVTILGDGTVTGNILLPGTLAPGSNANAGTIGEFEVVGDLDLSNSQVQIDLSAAAGTTNSDQITVSETATLTGGMLSFNFSGDQFETG